MGLWRENMALILLIERPRALLMFRVGVYVELQEVMEVESVGCNKVAVVWV